MEIFNASFQVVVFVAGLTCLVSTILGRPFGIGPIQVPAPAELLQRTALGALGLGLILLAGWSSLSSKKPAEIIAGWFIRPSPGPTAAAPAESGIGNQPWFTVASERVAISSVSSPGQSGIYIRNVGDRTIYVRFDSTSPCNQSSCHSDLVVAPIKSDEPAALDPTKPCDSDGHLSFDYPAAPTFAWKVWLGAQTSPVTCS
jgi:hypothetical protein